MRNSWPLRRPVVLACLCLLTTAVFSGSAVAQDASTFEEQTELVEQAIASGACADVDSLSQQLVGTYPQEARVYLLRAKLGECFGAPPTQVYPYYYQHLSMLRKKARMAQKWPLMSGTLSLGLATGGTFQLLQANKLAGEASAITAVSQGDEYQALSEAADRSGYSGIALVASSGVSAAVTALLLGKNRSLGKQYKQARDTFQVTDQSGQLPADLSFKNMEILDSDVAISAANPSEEKSDTSGADDLLASTPVSDAVPAPLESVIESNQQDEGDSNPALINPAVDYTVEHTWTLEFAPKYNFTPAAVGFYGDVGGASTGGWGTQLTLAEFQYAMFQVRGATVWVDGANNEVSTSILPLGLRLPPFQDKRFQPFYFYHWLINRHELGFELVPFAEDPTGFRASLMADNTGFVGLGLGASLGSEGDDSYDSIVDYYGWRLGLGGIGASFNPSQGWGMRGSLLDFQAAFFVTSLTDFSLSFGNQDPRIDYLSVLPVGIALPPVRDRMSLYYKMHWFPAYQASNIGMHTVGLAFHSEDSIWYGRVNMTTGVNNDGIATTTFGVEIESALVLLLLFGLGS